MTQPKKYCADLQGGLWLQFDTTAQQWMAKPCCLYQGGYPVTDNINEEFWKHPAIQKQRQDNLNGAELPISCRVCANTESNNNYSRRQSWNDRLGTSWKNPDSVIELDIQVDFSCNLACLICGPQYSTFWRHVLTKEEYEKSKKFKVRANNSNSLNLLDTIPKHDIRQVHFQGGEPLLSNTHIEILEKLQDKVDISQVIIWYHSNATTRVTDKVLKFWEKFKLVDIYFSLDDLGPRMEYQRWPCKWDEMSENLKWYRTSLPHNGMLNVERSIGVLNAAWVLELDNWHSENFSKTIYGDDIKLNYHDCSGVYSIGALSEEYKDYILTNIPQTHWVHRQVFNAQVNNKFNIRTMFENLNRNDAIRNNSWKAVYPEFLAWYKKYL